MAMMRTRVSSLPSVENAIDQFKLLKKRKLAEVDIHSVEDYKAMIGRGDRQEMRAAYLAKFGVEPEREFEGSSTVGSFCRAPNWTSARLLQTTPRTVKSNFSGSMRNPTGCRTRSTGNSSS